MTEVKMPEPFRTDADGEEVYVSYQMQQYGDDRARDALEMAAKLRQELHDVRFLYQRLCDHIQSDCL